MHVLTRFYSNVYKKSKWETAETGGNLTFFSYWLFFEKIKSLCIMTACMLSALRKQHVCDVKKNCNSNIFTQNCWKRLIATVECFCFCRFQTGRKNFCLGSNLVDKNWTSKLKLSSRTFAVYVAIIFQVYVRWKINVVKFNMWINWIQFRNPFLT